MGSLNLQLMRARGIGVVDGGCASFGSEPPEVAVAAIGVEGSGEGGSKGAIR